MRSIGNLLGTTIVGGLVLAACATGGTAEGTVEEREERVAPIFDSWAGLFRHHIPRARLRGECIASIGRGAESPPVIEVGGQRSYDGCPPPGIEPAEIARIEMLDSSEAGMLLGSRGEGGLVRMYTR